MQRIELTSTGIEIYCPFCGAQVIAEDGLSECEHTLFLASDEGGFEYISPKLELDMEIDLGEKSIDDFTDDIEYPNAIKFVIYQQAPSLFCGYACFAPE